MKDKIIKVGVLTAVFIAAVMIFSFITNQGNSDMTVEMDAATFPTISFVSEGKEINHLVGYKDEMNIPAMRDTITPVNQDNTVEIHLKLYEMQPKSMTYEVYTLDGKERLLQRTEKTLKETMELSVGNVLLKGKEGVLKITLNIDEEQNIRYYTRIAKSNEYHVKECVQFVQTLHTNIINKADTDSISAVIEPNAEGDNTTFQHVTLHSDLDHVTWGKLLPEVVGDIQWDIKEMTTTYMSMQLKYQVKCKGDDNEEEIHNVKEFFRVRYLKGKLYLLNYDRTMNQVLESSSKILSGRGIHLGIVPKNIQYETNEDGSIVSFVQERELWCFDKDEDELALVFSFADTEKNDVRNLYDQHAIKIISIDKDGNTTFAVYGYMNRGEHEGEVGAAIYYFNLSQNVVEEKAFIPSNKSFTIAEEELGKLVYYNNEKNMLYVLVDGTIYKVDLETEKKEAVVKSLTEGQYVASEDGHLIAYQNNGGLTDSTEVTILNFLTGKIQTVSAAEGENIRPLGFISEDFVYGTLRAADVGKTVSGSTLLPMYKLEIKDAKGNIVKTYQFENVYISDVFVESNMITLNRVTKSGEIYTTVDRDYITNNEEKEESNISLQEYSTDLKELQYRLVYADGIDDKKPKILKPKQVLYENPTTVAFDSENESRKFYVYGLGQMLGFYDKAGYAIQKADDVSGVVVSSSQTYVWERGNRDLRHDIDLEGFTVGEGETTLAACIRQILAMEGKDISVMEEMNAGKSAIDILSEHSEGEGMDLTGCTTEEMLYIIGKGTPVVAMTDSANAVLLIGYDTSSVTYIDPADGGVHITTPEEMDSMVAGSGHTFIGYVK